MYDAVIKLLDENIVCDETTGIMTKSAETERIAYAQLESISRSEWAEASQEGLNPEFRLRLPRSSYRGEVACKIGSTRYGIYRTFARKGEIELYLTRKVGVTNGE